MTQYAEYYSRIYPQDIQKELNEIINEGNRIILISHNQNFDLVTFNMIVVYEDIGGDDKKNNNEGGITMA